MKTISYLLCFLMAFKVYSGIENPNSVPLGEKEAFMANAGVALNGSPGNVIYNPAGLVKLKGQKISATGTTYGFIEAKQNSAEGPRKWKSFTAIPTTTVYSKNYGNWTGAFSVIIPLTLNSSLQFLGTAPDGTLNTTAVVKSDSNELYTGFSAAVPINKTSSVGISLYAHNFREESTAGFHVFPQSVDIDGAFTEQKIISTWTTLAILSYSQRVNSKFAYAIKLQTPNIKIRGRGRKIVYSLITAFGSEISHTKSDIKYDSDNKMPLDISLGLQFNPTETLAIFFDTAHQWATEFSKFIGESSELSVITKKTFRFHLGSDWQFHKEYSLLNGFYIIPSTYKRSLDTSNPNVNNLFGTTAGIFYNQENFRSGVGGFYLFSKTQNDLFGSVQDNSSLRFYGIILSGLFSF